MNSLEIIRTWGRLALLGLLGSGIFALASDVPPVTSESAPRETLSSSPASSPSKKPGKVIQLSPAPSFPPETLPVPQMPGGYSPLSPDNPDNIRDGMRFEPYNTFPREVDLWNLEGERLIRSLPVVSPDRREFVYTEMMFIPTNRQTFSRLYRVVVPPPPPMPEPHKPSEDAGRPPQPFPDPSRNPDLYAARYLPEKTVKSRQSLVSVGYEEVRGFEFKTLTVVDWAFHGRRILVKERKGILHVGLRTSDILIVDLDRGTVTVYPEIHRVIRYYWANHGNLPELERLSWDIQPLGWQPDSDSVILLKAWAYDRNERKFLGLWRYDVDAERTELISLENMAAPVAANGWLAVPVPVPSPPDRSWKQKLRRPFSRQTSM